MVRIDVTFSIDRDIAVAFWEACRHTGTHPDVEVEALMKDFIGKKADDMFVSRMDKAGEGDSGLEQFKVDIWCEDPLCRSPKIVLEGIMKGRNPRKK